MQNYKVTILILDYLKAKQVVENVKSIIEQEVNFQFKIIVIDNSCNELNANILKHCLKDFECVKVIINQKNVGYIKAHNQVNKEIEGQYVAIVNPDIMWKEKDALLKMVDYLDKHKDIGILGPKQINNDGVIAMTVRAFPKFFIQVARRTFFRKIPILKNFVEYDEMQHLDYSKIQDVDWLQSSCVIIRKELWDDIKGLCKDYFLFMSDVELCYQVWKRGKRVVYYPETQVYADGKRVSAGGFKQFFKNWVLRQHVVDSLRYMFKHFFEKNPRKIYIKTQK
ncbi:glycosyl transferase family 2 [Candidatus Kuenenbacteria bacterium HGW-Kuenenbacteria-1]|uniref:Glycosyl transferase family 2 n=1 Tax=Candidatus Kuenenbacteria bacterium HGW-Kuenenbacteria-1 TaxID=2013812 RepID=A0A2N1UN33_9BACT|nr:MAG: glycosyl transferase family 2 [Candidatus Kuenenbacteria bacterium HGW-Kuenenbacteria-1]